MSCAWPITDKAVVMARNDRKPKQLLNGNMIGTPELR
jgi:hypothetical protein